MSEENKWDRQARTEKVAVGDIVTVSAAEDTVQWEVVNIDDMNVMLRENGTDYRPQAFPKDCLYDVRKASTRTFTSGVEAVYGPAPTLEWEHGSDEFTLRVPDSEGFKTVVTVTDGHRKSEMIVPMKVKDIQGLIDLLDELSETHARAEWREENGPDQ